MTKETLYARCGICGNKCTYDKETLESSTHEINGVRVVLCGPCEDDLLKALFEDWITRKELHEAEMELANLCDNNEITRDKIIDTFTNLMCRVPGD